MIDDGGCSDVAELVDNDETTTVGYSGGMRAGEGQLKVKVIDVLTAVKY